MAPRRISILGGGLMGHGIALVFARAGHDVTLSDPSEAVREKVLERIAATLTELGEDTAAVRRVKVVEAIETCVAKADFVIEIAFEAGTASEMAETIHPFVWDERHTVRITS